MRAHVLGDEEKRMDIGVERRQPLLLGQARDVVVPRLLHSVVQHQHVNPPHRPQHLVHHLPAGRLRPQVHGVQVTAGPCGLDARTRLLRVRLLRGQVRNEDVGALHGVEDGGGAADAGVAAGDEGLFARELAPRLVDLVAAVLGGDVLGFRLRALHAVLEAGLGLEVRRGHVPGLELRAHCYCV